MHTCGYNLCGTFPETEGDPWNKPPSPVSAGFHDTKFSIRGRAGVACFNFSVFAQKGVKIFVNLGSEQNLQRCWAKC